MSDFVQADLAGRSSDEEEEDEKNKDLSEAEALRKTERSIMKTIVGLILTC